MRSIRKIAIFSLLILGKPIFSQPNIEGFIGYNRTDIAIIDNCYDCGSINSGSNSSTIGIGVENIKVDWLKLRFTLRYDSFDAEINTDNGGLGGGNTVDATVNKATISLGVFPINFKLFKSIDINLGLEISHRVYDEFSGTFGFWVINEYPEFGISKTTWGMTERFNHMGTRTTIGIRSRIAYDIKISDDLYISPQGGLYVGLSDELQNVLVGNRSIRYSASIGIEKRF